MSHENGYSRGVSLLEPIGLLQGNITATFNLCQLIANNGARNSPWEGISSGYSSTSPPDTASSGSSSNSQCYRRSPDGFSADSMITDILWRVAKSDSFPTSPVNPQIPFSNGFPPAICGDSFGSSPDSQIQFNNGFGTARCGDSFCESPDSQITLNNGFEQAKCGIDCMEPLCDSCFAPPQNRSGSSTLLDQLSSLQPGSMDMPSPPMLRPSSASLSPNLSSQQFYCEIHREAQRVYCQTCSKTSCSECATENHVGHLTVNFMEAVEGAGVQAHQVMKEATLGIKALREDLNSVQIAAESLEYKARQATDDVKLCVRRVASALEAREQELLERIEKARLFKFASLQARDEGLRNGITRLTTAVDKLSVAMESSAVAVNPFDLLVTKDMASAEVFEIRQNRKNLPPPEEHWISFTGPEGAVLHAIANFGSIMITSPGPIGDRRAVRGRGPSPQTSNQGLQMVPLGPIPRGRPVPSNSFPVTVRTGRSSLSPAPKPVNIIGNDGAAHDNLCRPWGVACDKEGNVIVADRSNNRIQIYREDGQFVRRFGTHGSGPGQFDRPAGVAVDGRRRIIVADKDNHRIQILTMAGIYLLSFGEKGCRCGQFNYPWDVAVNTECQIVVSDTRNHRIQLFSPEGVFLRKYGHESTPSMWKIFDSPRGVAFNPEGNVVCTDFNNHRVVVLDSEFLNAKSLSPEGSGGTKQFLRPQGLVIDDEGNIIVADSRNHRIQVFDSAGTLKWKFGSYGKGDDEMDRPSGIALSPTGKIAVVDFGNNRVLMI